MHLLGWLFCTLGMLTSCNSLPSHNVSEYGFPLGSLEVKQTLYLRVEIAETDAQQAQGLMYRQSLPIDAGMVFVFDTPVSYGFWMKNTLIPLSIAFYDQNGVILKILDMEPCMTESCSVYSPGIAYSGALEVNQGWFTSNGVEPGDTLRLIR